MSMNGLRNAISCTSWCGIRMMTTIVSATSRCYRCSWLTRHSSTSVVFGHNIHREGPEVAGVPGARPACWFFARLIWPVTTRQKQSRLRDHASHRIASAGRYLPARRLICSINFWSSSDMMDEIPD